jgi:hypothetical protein
VSISSRYLEISKTLEGIDLLKSTPFNFEDSIGIEDYHLRPFTSRGISNEELAKFRTGVLSMAGVSNGNVKQITLKPIEFDQLFVRNCQILFQDFESIDTFQSEVWSYITIRVLPDLALWRWPDNAPERYFGNPERNAFQRLWHRSFILGPELGSELQEDEAISIFERMEALGSNKHVAVPLARRIVKYRLNRSKNEPGSSEVTSQVVVRLRRAMAVTNIVSLSEREIEKLIDDQFGFALESLAKNL